MAVFIEEQLELFAHRVSAHRALSLNPSVPKISEREALNGLRTGATTIHRQSNAVEYRKGSRWQSREATFLLNDFDFLVQALFAEQANTALKSLEILRSGSDSTVEPTKFEQLSKIWENLLPHRKLKITGDDISVQLPGSEATYPASEMSDGERAIFYLLGQTLVTAENSVLVIDEPELHMHPSIMTLLWDKLATARPDCAFVFITHSLEFAASRPGDKYIVRNYGPGQTWAIDPVPTDTGFDEDFATLMLGSRQPVLFVEGINSSLDQTIYRACYPDHLVLPRESCEAVIRGVASMRSNAAFTRIDCRGIVDGDHRSGEEIHHLRELGIAVLPVAEVENVLLLPTVSRAIAAHEGYDGDSLDERIDGLKQAVFSSIASDNARRSTVLRYVARQADRHLKRIDLGAATSIEDLELICAKNVKELDVQKLASDSELWISTAIKNDDLPGLLALHENKGLLALAAKHLKGAKVGDFKEWLERILRQDGAPELTSALQDALPKLP